LPVASIEAVEEFDEAHVTNAVMSWVEASE
jgi:hypothetical protein